MRISVEDLFEGVADGDAADVHAHGHARARDARLAMMNGRVNHDSVLARSRACMIPREPHPRKPPCRRHATLTGHVP
jgi:hypothetical protein